MNSGDGGIGGSSAELEFNFKGVLEPESDTLLGGRSTALVTCFTEATDCGAAVVAAIGVCRAICVVVVGVAAAAATAAAAL